MSFLRRGREEREEPAQAIASIRDTLTSLEKRIAALPEALQEPIRSMLRVPLAQLQASVEEVRGSLADIVEMLQRLGVLEEKLQEVSEVVEKQAIASADILDISRKISDAVEKISGTIERVEAAGLSDLRKIVAELQGVGETHVLMRESLENIAKLLEFLGTATSAVEEVSKRLMSEAERYSCLLYTSPSPRD